MKRFAIAALMPLSYGYSLCCSCFPEKKISVDALLSFNYVFIGRVIDAKEIPYDPKRPDDIQADMGLFVVETWISDHDIADTVAVYSGRNSCGVGSFVLGEKWLVYTWDYGGLSYTDQCTPSREISSNERLPKSIRHLKKLKLSSGDVKEKVESSYGTYIVYGKLRHGKPIGQWLRVRGKDTLAIFNFINGKHDGFQMEVLEEREDTIQRTYIRTNDKVVINTMNRSPHVTYELKNGLRFGKYDVYLNVNGGDHRISVPYKNGKIDGEWVSWRVDPSKMEDWDPVAKEIKYFNKGELKRAVRYDNQGKEIPY
jgi:antitoxin component YwqK of YwqJK toxin-antitoxin module